MHIDVILELELEIDVERDFSRTQIIPNGVRIDSRLTTLS